MTEATSAGTLPAPGAVDPLLRLFYSNYDKSVWAKARARLHDMGVDAKAEFAVRSRRLGTFVAMARVARNGPGFFDFDEGGEWHCVLAEPWGGELIDLIAFPFDAPQRLMRLRGIPSVLGEEEVSRTAYVDGKAQLWDDPLQWLRAGGEGGVVLEFSPPPWCLQQAVLTASSLELARRLRRAYATPPPQQPEVVVGKGVLR